MNLLDSTFEVRDPSGATRTVVGQLGDLSVGASVGVSPIIFHGRTRATVLDPRAVVFQGGRVVVDPRSPARLARAPAWVRAWLRAHPEWPRLVTEAPSP
jgi:hypothetical protein